MATAPIRLGLVGIGRAGWGMHCEELAGREEQFQIVAACDIIPARCAKMAARYGCATYGTIEELIADPRVDVVDIATRSCDHFAQAMLALEAGKTVFLEKPMTTSFAEAAALQRAVAAGRGALYIRHNRRFEPAFQHVREIIASGILGDVYEIKLRRAGYQRRDDWQTLIEFGGGQLLNWGPHIIDHGLRLLESPVKCMWSDLKRIAAVGDAEDHLKIVLVGENGRLVDLEISGGAALSEPVYLVSGTRGALRCADERALELRYLDPAQPVSARTADPGTPGEGGFGSAEALPWVERTIPVSPAYACDMTTVWDALYATIRHGAPYPIPLEQAVAVMEVISTVKIGTPFECATAQA